MRTFRTSKEALRYHVSGAIERGQAVAIAGVERKPNATFRMTRLKDLQAMPDDQAYRCWDVGTARYRGIDVPFECGCRQWIGDGLVKVDHYVEAVEGQGFYPAVSVVQITSLEPIDGRWTFE